MKLIVGLGNPGKDYARTRHNVGFATIDKLAEEFHVDVSQIKFQSLLGEFRYNNEKILLVKPTTYMNKSGQAVGQIARYYNIEDQDIIIIYDDMDIEFGKIKIRKKGSGGGHNGMKSIISHLSSQDFPRIRIGIGRRHPRQELTNFVLSRFSKEEQEVIDQAIDEASQAALSIIDDGVESAMNKFN